MELEQEMASIIKFVIERAGQPAPYYWNVPQNFQVPAAFFPPPELDTGGETFLTYYVDFAWYIKLFHRRSQEAYAIGSMAANAIRAERNLIPLIAQDGTEIAGEWVRVNDPSLKNLDDGAAQLTLTWRSRRPYSDTVDSQRQKSMNYYLDIFMKSGKTVSDAYAEALERYVLPSTPGGEPE